MIKVGLAGSIRDYDADHLARPARCALDDRSTYGGQPAGYASAPGEVGQLRREPRQPDAVRQRRLQAAAGHRRAPTARACRCSAPPSSRSARAWRTSTRASTLLRIASRFDSNSFDSGDWFNRLDWTLRDNNFGVGLPPQAGQRRDCATSSEPLLANAAHQADAGRHRLGARRLPRPAAHPRQHAAVPPAHAPPTCASASASRPAARRRSPP